MSDTSAPCNAPAPDIFGTGHHHLCSKPAGHALPHANDEGLMWDSGYVGWPTASRKLNLTRHQ